MAAASSFQDELDRFLTDIAMSFATHRSRSAAVVWPRGESLVLQAVTASHGRAEPSRDGSASAVGRRLGELLDRQVQVGLRTVEAGHVEEDQHITADTFVVMVKGVVEVRLQPLGADWPAEVTEFHHRLLAGQVLYAPAQFSCSVTGQHSSALLLELTLDA
ncbi:hypothetical protein [Streptomyces sp. NPDC058683]|uniref:hypothetical protein n=1 Tax=Streptomyces sp. NPDC058683 TaxID=3346597 RepID=UPI00364CD777